MSKPFVFDLRKFKKVGGDKMTTTLKHPDGHSIKIAHKSLSPKMRSQLAELPMALAEGGEVAENAIKKEKYDDEDDIRGKTVDEDELEPEEESELDKSGNMFMAKGGQVDPTQQHTFYGDAIPNAIEKEVVDKSKRRLNMADGGDVPKGVTADSSEPETASQQAPVVVNVNNGQGSSSPSKPIPSDQLMGGQQMAPTPPPQAAPTPPPAAAPGPALGPDTAVESARKSLPGIIPGDTYGTQTQSNAAMQGMAENQAGINLDAYAATKAAGDKALVLHTMANAQKAEAENFKTKFANLETEQGKVIEDMKNNHIDPQHYMHSLDTGQRITTAIGLILGGIGGGRGENPALTFLNSQIDRDIKAQEANMGQRKSLLEANLKQFGNRRDATDMTRLQLQGLALTQLEEAAAKSGSAVAEARRLQLSGVMKSQMAATLGQMAMRQSIFEGAKNGIVTPERTIQMVVPENEKKYATDQLKLARDSYAVRDNLLSAFDQLNKTDSLGNYVLAPIQTWKQVNAIKMPLIAALSKATAGRFTAADAKMVESLFPTYGDRPDTLEIKRTRLNALISEKLHFDELKKWNIDPATFSRYNAQGQSNIPLSKPKTK